MAKLLTDDLWDRIGPLLPPEPDEPVGLMRAEALGVVLLREGPVVVAVKELQGPPVPLPEPGRNRPKGEVTPSGGQGMETSPHT